MKLSDLIKIGTLGNTINKDGMVKCNLKSDFIDINLENVFLIFRDDKVRYVSVIKESQSGVFRIILDDIEVMQEAVKEKDVIIALPQNEIEAFGKSYHDNLINYKIFQDNIEIGYVIEEFDNFAQKIITIKTEDGQDFMIPVVEKYIIQIDNNSKSINVKEIDGLLEL